MNIRVIQGTSVAFFAVTAFLIWQIIDIYPQIAVLQGNISSQEENIKDSEDTLKRLKEFVVFTADNKESIKKFDSILPGEEEKANLLSNLDNLASANGLSTLKISFEADTASAAVSAGAGAESAASDYSPINIKMSMRGSYLSFKNFLAAIEKNLRVVDVISTDFAVETSSKQIEGERKSYAYAVGLRAYLQRSAEEKDILKLLHARKYKSFTAKQLNFTKEKVFSGLPEFFDYNTNAGVGEIGNSEIF